MFWHKCFGVQIFWFPSFFGGGDNLLIYFRYFFSSAQILLKKLKYKNGFESKTLVRQVQVRPKQFLNQGANLNFCQLTGKYFRQKLSLPKNKFQKKVSTIVKLIFCYIDILINTPGTRVGSGFRNQTLAVKSIKSN